MIFLQIRSEQLSWWTALYLINSQMLMKMNLPSGFGPDRASSSAIFLKLRFADSANRSWFCWLLMADVTDCTSRIWKVSTYSIVAYFWFKKYLKFLYLMQLTSSIDKQSSISVLCSTGGSKVIAKGVFRHHYNLIGIYQEVYDFFRWARAQPTLLSCASSNHFAVCTRAKPKDRTGWTEFKITSISFQEMFLKHQSV